MNKYRIYICLTIMLSLAVCTTQTRHSRKRYQKKKQSSVNTLIDVNSGANNRLMSRLEQGSPVTALPAAAQSLAATPHAHEFVELPYIPQYTLLTEEQKVPAPIEEVSEETEDSIEFNFEHAD